MWIDTHIHLDAAEYAGQQSELIAQARRVDVQGWVIPSVLPSNFDTVRALAHATPGAAYALGIHPLYVLQCADNALDQLQAALEANHTDPKLVAVGEIGLDYFVPGLDASMQQHYFKAQLKLAQRYGLPVILHVRRSADHIAKYLRQTPAPSGIAHAFNGSAQQAQALVDLGLCLGFGGAATYGRALQIRERLKTLPASSIVLETDGPDIAPEWLARQVNPPVALAGIGSVLAGIRGIDVSDFAGLCASNSFKALPRLKKLVA
jgi:TatD DNase family protein